MTFLSSLFGLKSPQSDKIEILDTATFKVAILEKKVQLVDVRTAQEFHSGYIGNAINIDYFKQENFKTLFEKFDKNKPVYLYCRSGNRSQKAARKLISMGFTRIYDLKGGYLNWN
ncbi:MAG: rhodanese-like domain-containing protein [Cellulophaga sp.]